MKRTGKKDKGIDMKPRDRRKELCETESFIRSGDFMFWLHRLAPLNLVEIRTPICKLFLQFATKTAKKKAHVRFLLSFLRAGCRFYEFFPSFYCTWDFVWWKHLLTPSLLDSLHPLLWNIQFQNTFRIHVFFLRLNHMKEKHAQFWILWKSCIIEIYCAAVCIIITWQ